MKRIRLFRQAEPYLLAAVYCAIPVVTLAADNAELVRLSAFFPYYLGCVTVGCVAVAVARARRGPAGARTAGPCVAIAVLMVFDYHELRPLLASVTHEVRPAMVYLWAVLFGAAVFAVARLSNRVAVLSSAALVAGMLMLIPPSVRYAETRSELARDTPARIPTGSAAHRLAEDRPRNVYFFLLDAYARPDRMREQFGFDDGSFVHALRGRGFVVPPETRSSYPLTLQSVPSILSMAYQDDARVAARQMAGHNRVAKTFRRLGYRFALAPSELEGWGCTGLEDICVPAATTYASRMGLSDLDWAVLERTPGADLLKSIRPAVVNSVGAKRQFPLDVAEAVTSRRSRRPMFVFAHSLLPHTPYPYQGPGCRLQPGEPRGADSYVGAVECANSNTLEAVRVITRKDPGAVVVIASDHGTEVGSALASAQPGSLDARRRLSNFVALRLPRACRDDVPRALAAVNIFRVVMNCLTTSRLRLLPYRSVLS